MTERLDRFMARANAAYYATHDPFADFTTAPEIAQAFGEILGLWCAVVWDQAGRPDPVVLAEAGPGRGTLMADALRAVGQTAPAFGAALRLHLIETSPRLRAIQADRLPEATWHDRIDELPPAPLLLLGNEFLDALPVRQFVRRGDVWAERHVADGRFAERPADDPPAPDAADGTVAERCEAALDLARTLTARLVQYGGAALFLDYGGGAGDTLQSLRAGRPADPLADPGSADLTAHVDFAAFADAARDSGATVHGPEPQGLFLARLGLFQRTDRLARGKPPAQAAALIDAARRLAEPDRMGRLFNALAVCHPGLPTPPGFSSEQSAA
jgi:SAM-dependent MidA family methyltransferase